MSDDEDWTKQVPRDDDTVDENEVVPRERAASMASNKGPPPELPEKDPELGQSGKYDGENQEDLLPPLEYDERGRVILRPEHFGYPPGEEPAPPRNWGKIMMYTGLLINAAACTVGVIGMRNERRLYNAYKAGFLGAEGEEPDAFVQGGADPDRGGNPNSWWTVSVVGFNMVFFGLIGIAGELDIHSIVKRNLSFVETRRNNPGFYAFLSKVDRLLSHVTLLQSMTNRMFWYLFISCAALGLAGTLGLILGAVSLLQSYFLFQRYYCICCEEYDEYDEEDFRNAQSNRTMSPSAFAADGVRQPAAAAGRRPGSRRRGPRRMSRRQKSQYYDDATSVGAVDRSHADNPYRPNWQADDARKDCNYCSREFGVFRRRHHCRHCGLVFCDDCSVGREEIPIMDYNEPVRVCLTCQKVLVQQRGFIGIVRAKHAYAAAEDNEISFPKGAVILLQDRDKSGWWAGEHAGKQGLFPSTYVADNI